MLAALITCAALTSSLLAQTPSITRELEQSGATRVLRQSWPEVDALMAEFDSSAAPGVAVGILRDDEQLYVHAVGMAGIEEGVAFSTQTPTYMASNDKQFVAQAVLMLVDDGELTLEDDISEHLPEMQLRGVSVRHLLTHTSGIREHYELMRMAGHPWGWEPYEILVEQTATNFEPGTAFHYSNSNYVLLRRLIQNITGAPYQATVQERIFEPLGMSSSTYLVEDRRLLSQGAHHYGSDQNGKPVPVRAHGGTGLYSTVEDMLRWARNTYAQSIGSPGLQQDRYRSPEVGDGRNGQYACGIWVTQFAGAVSYEHGGGTPGCSTYFAVSPDSRDAIVVLSNTDMLNAQALARSIRGVADSQAGGTSGKSSPDDLARVRMDPEQVPDLSGVYYAFMDDTYYELTLSSKFGTWNAELPNVMPKLPLDTHRQGETVVLSVSTVEFRAPMEDQPTALDWFYEGEYLTSFERTAPVDYVAEDYRGVYTAPELFDAEWTVEAKGGNLNIVPPKAGDPASPLESVGADVFVCANPALKISFRRSADGVVAGMSAETAGIKRLQLDRR